MGKLQFCRDCWFGLSLLGVAFFTYLTLICIFSPDRLHILKHRDQKEDADNYATAWSTAASVAFLYLLLAGALFFFKFNKHKDRENLRKWLKGQKAEEKLNNPYELKEYVKYNQEKETEEKIK